MSTPKVNELFSALQALDAANKANAIQVWIPSQERYVDFTPITTGQQKAIIRALVDNPVYQTNFIIAVYDIIKANNRDETLNIDSLLITDKLAISIQLRQNSIGNTVAVKNDDKTVLVTLQPVKTSKPEHIMETVLTENGYTIKCAIPTIKREVQLEKELRVKLSNSELGSYEDVRNVLADAYIGELAKHIQTVNIGETEINVASLNFADAYTVIERLPATVIKAVVSYMEEIQRYMVIQRTYLTTPDKPDDVAKGVEITIDAAFFTTK